MKSQVTVYGDFVLIKGHLFRRDAITVISNPRKSLDGKVFHLDIVCDSNPSFFLEDNEQLINALHSSICRAVVGQPVYA